MISVVIPTYNHAAFVREAIDSALSQQGVAPDELEVVVINDGSPDDTDQVLKPLVEAGRIRYFEQANAGQAVARQRGWQEARGEFIAFLDDDDRFAPGKLAWQLDQLRQHPEAVLVYGDHGNMREDGRFVPEPPAEKPSGDVYDSYRRRNWIHSPGQTLIRRDALERVGGFDADIWGSDDWDLYIRLAQLGPFVYQPRPALEYRLHANNASKRAVHHARNHLKVVARHIGVTQPVLLLRSQRASASYFLPNLVNQARDAWRAGRRAEAATALGYACMFGPVRLTRRLLKGA